MAKYAKPPPGVSFLPDVPERRPLSGLSKADGGSPPLPTGFAGLGTGSIRRKGVWRSRSESTLLPLPPLTKGASRHRLPFSGDTGLPDPEALSQTQAMLAWQDEAMRLEAQRQMAETAGRKILEEDAHGEEDDFVDREELWPKKVFAEADGGMSGYLLPAEFAALCARLQRELGEVGAIEFRFRFQEADKDYDGRISLEEWEDYCERLEEVFGKWRCEVAALRYLGTRSAELRRKVGTVYMFEGYDHAATLRLLSACSNWNSHTLLDSVRSALKDKADPNAGLAADGLNDFTPLILLAKAYPTVDGRQIGVCIDELITARADVHRESGPMEFGRLLPLRFAAQLQNDNVLRTLLKHVEVGDCFQWAAGEDVDLIMLDELQRKFGAETVQYLRSTSQFNMTATVLLRAFASPIVGTLTPEGAEKLLTGKFLSSKLKLGDKADPNDSGLQGITALMDVVKKGDVNTVRKLLEGGASTNMQDSSGATALHLASAGLQLPIVKALLKGKARPDLVDHAGFSPWMLVGEHCDETADPAARRELLELLRPRIKPEVILHKAERGGDDLVNEEGSSPDILAQRLRLHESLFFNPRVVDYGAVEGRQPRNHLLKKVASVIISLLRTDPLEGHRKALCKYLLQATRGPTNTPCPHVVAEHRWCVEDNRGIYRHLLMDAVRQMMTKFAAECNAMRKEIEARAKSDPGGACAALVAVPGDRVSVPFDWRRDPFWAKVQERQLLRYDPQWAVGRRDGEGVRDGASCFMALLRLGAVTSLEQYSDLLQVQHLEMEALLAKGYATYSNLCNEKFQNLIRGVAERVAKDEGLEIMPPPGYVPAKGLPRLIEKTKEARSERGGLEWPGLPAEYLRFSHCFHILDTVRLSFICGGASLPDQVACCMKLLGAFSACTVEEDRFCLLRQKSGFAAGVAGSGGYADVKLLMYADLGTHTAFDGTQIPLRIVGEVQLILQGYMAVKKRMHLVYEVERGSFDPKHS